MNFCAFFKSPRFWGIGGLSLVAYFLVFGVFGKVDISGLLPIEFATSLQTHWPDLPFFTMEKHAINGGQSQEVYYTVPTRQLTAKEVAQLEAQGKVSKPAGHPTPSPATR